jgi:ferredoxin-NADP reductase
MMKEIRVKLMVRIKRTESIESFRFLPSRKVDFTPGQFLQVIFDEKNIDNKELNKYLSFSSSPAKQYIEFTKRLSQSSFSERLRVLKPNDEVLLKAPLGSCVFKEEYKKIGFLIGGIGITPVISILEYIVEKKTTTNAILFYSNSSEEEVAFRKELDEWQKCNCNLKIIYTVTERQSKDPRCYFGRIDKALVAANASDIKERMVFIFGPPKMVEAMSSLSIDLGCSQENMKTENFIGY